MSSPPDGEGFTVKEILLRVEEKVDKVADDHETRIRSLERWKWGLPVSAVGAAVAAAIALYGGPTP